MHVYSISIFKVEPGQNAILLNIVYDVSSFSFWYRNEVRGVLLFVSRETAGRTSVGERVSMEHAQKVCHTTVGSNGLSAAVTTDSEYPSRVAHNLVRMVMEKFQIAHQEAKWKSVQKDTEFPLPELEGILLKYQNPQEADPMLNLQKNLEETMGIVKKTVEQLGQRGERLEDIAAKSNDLNFQSKAFMQNSERLNKCCSYM
ncbi:longin domain-containing protein [Tieghemostelium lacteum]|uniref:Longin domain-containing protein n=1 Tax=Tieghemostelium lacteum TaxID=361077 RepID=A0A151ZEI8_TIELA|nr:longin domain-containing protein [Tieghemostelium lacteum]|eukprot:KYQ92345.1 longin domain-containing protein [Tieghemostelium lacteum]